MNDKGYLRITDRERGRMLAAEALEDRVERFVKGVSRIFPTGTEVDELSELRKDVHSLAFDLRCDFQELIRDYGFLKIEIERSGEDPEVITERLNYLRQLEAEEARGWHARRRLIWFAVQALEKAKVSDDVIAPLRERLAERRGDA